MPNSQSVFKGSTLLSSKRGTIACASTPGTVSNLNLSERGRFDALIGRFNGTEPFRGKPGSVSFNGLTHQLVEEGKLMSSPFQEDKTSFLWVLAPVALISSLILPQFFLANLIEAFVKDEMLLGISILTQPLPYFESCPILVSNCGPVRLSLLSRGYDLLMHNTLLFSNVIAFLFYHLHHR